MEERLWPHVESADHIAFGHEAPTCSCRQTFTILTGFEEPGRCFWCGREIPEGGRHKHYCTPWCSKEYHRHFFWSYAIEWAFERAEHRCQLCGAKQESLPRMTWENGVLNQEAYREEKARWQDFKLEVHHIIELEGGTRWISVLNCPCNLLVLCHACHWAPQRHGKKPRFLVPQPCPMFPNLAPLRLEIKKGALYGSTST